MRHQRRLLPVALAVAALTTLGVTAGSPAQARSAPAAVQTAATDPGPVTQSAAGASWMNPFCFSFGGQNICVPTTMLVHVITGNGRTITNQEAEIQDSVGGGTAGGQFCNWRFDWKYYDTNGRNYLTSLGTTHHSCNEAGVGRGTSADRTLAYYGRACAVFYVNGTERGRQCHNITR